MAAIKSDAGKFKLGGAAGFAVGIFGATDCTPKKLWTWRMNAATRVVKLPGNVNSGRLPGTVFGGGGGPKKVCQSLGEASARSPTSLMDIAGWLDVAATTKFVLISEARNLPGVVVVSKHPSVNTHSTRSRNAGD